MTVYAGDSDYRHGTPPRLGVLVTNLGTPADASPAAVRSYLKEFLWDPRVVERPRWLWWLILNGIVLQTRPRRSAAAYRKVWTPEGSPLLYISRRQADALGEELARRLDAPVEVTLAMRYGEPSIPDALEALRAAGVRRLLVLPLYPQYSATTTASTFDAVSRVLSRWRWLPELRFLTQYHDHDGYIAALAASVRESFAEHGEPERLLMSFHGLPRRYLLAGDPYHCQCHKTARLLADALGLDDDRWHLSFQSRVGPEEWLGPYTDVTLKAWGGEGVQSVQVVAPGFSADCLETLEEIDEQNREFFQEAGGGSFHYIPALNDRPDHVAALADIVTANLQGWPEVSGTWSAETDAAACADARRRATAMGAAR